MSATSFELRCTINRATRDKLSQAQALLRHRIPSGEVGAIVDLALDALLSQVRKDKFAATDAPRPNPSPATAGSRHIPAHVKRAVHARDGERCAFIAASGRRCDETAFLEYHHVDPHGMGGLPTVANCQIVCRSHNAYWAIVDYGVAHMQRAQTHSTATTDANTTNATKNTTTKNTTDTISVPTSTIATAPNPTPIHAELIRDATAALHTAGFSLSVSRRAVRAATSIIPTPETLEALIRASLQQTLIPASTGAREPRTRYHLIPASTGARESRTRYRLIPASTGARYIPASTEAREPRTRSRLIPASTGARESRTRDRIIPASPGADGSP